MPGFMPEIDVRRVVLVLLVCAASLAGGFVVGMWLGS